MAGLGNGCTAGYKAKSFLARKWHRFLSAGAALFILSCAGVPEEYNLRLDPSGAIPVAAMALNGPLQVQPFQARGLLSERRLAYLDAQAPTLLRQSATLFWEEPPQVAAAIVTTRALRSANIAPAVFAPDQPGIAEYFLSARLNRFELAQRPAGPAASIALEVTVLQGRERQPFLIASYCAEEPGGADIAAVQTAFDEAFHRLLLMLTRDLTARASGQRPPVTLDGGQRSAPC